MHRLLLVGFLGMLGCQGVVGPAQRLCLTEPIDAPYLSPQEQQQRRRDRLGAPEGNRAYGPRTYAEEPALKGP